MGDTLNKVAVQILIYIAPILAGLLIEYIWRKIGTEKINKLQVELATKQDLASLAIKFVEQAYTDLKGPDKYNQAANWLAARAGEKSIKVTPDEIKGLIEAAVRMAKDEFGEQWASAEASAEEPG